MKKLYAFLCMGLIMLCGMMFNSFNMCFAQESLPKVTLEHECSGSAAIVLDAFSGRVFYEKNADEQRAIASTTKIATAITVIKNCADLNAIVKVDKKAIGIEGTSIYLREGEELSVKDLLYGLMLRSGNDAATALAIYVGKDVESFCALMNETATLAGATNTHFSNPHGLDAEDHYTTARDLALITAYALENDEFREIVSTQSVKIPSKEEEYRFLANKNRLLHSLDGCIGVKTGFTTKAGRCLVSATERDGLRLVCVVLNCGPMFEESADLLNEVHSKYKMYEVLEPHKYIADVQLLNGESQSVQVCTKNGLKLALTEEEMSNLNINYDLPEYLTAPLDADKEVGEVKVYYGKHLIFSEKIYTIYDIESKLLKDKVKNIIDLWGI